MTFWDYLAAHPEFMTRGCFVVLEGLDGSGKTTQAKLLAESLAREGYAVERTAEPTHDGPVGARLLRPILRGELDAPDARTMALLFVADRMDHCAREIGPWLDQGKVVICDRYALSTLIYQTLAALPNLASCGTCGWTGDDPLGRGWCPSCKYARLNVHGREYMDWLRELGRDALVPDLTLVLDMTPEEATRRRAARGQSREYYERRQLQARAYELYQQAGRLLFGERVVHVSGEQDAASAAAMVLAAVRPFLSGSSA